jgi:hypothetical protein
VNTYLADAVIDVLSDAGSRSSSRWSEWLADVTRPPEGLRVVSEDGAIYNGIVVVRKNQPIAALVMNVVERRASREPPVERPHDDQTTYPFFQRPY